MFFFHFVVTLVVRINGYVLFIYLSVFLLKIFHSNEVIFCSSISLLLHIFTIYENHLSSIFATFSFHIHRSYLVLTSNDCLNFVSFMLFQCLFFLLLLAIHLFMRVLAIEFEMLNTIFEQTKPKCWQNKYSCLLLQFNIQLNSTHNLILKKNDITVWAFCFRASNHFQIPWFSFVYSLIYFFLYFIQISA